MAVETTQKAQPFSLRTPLLAQGKSETLLAEADALDVRIKVYAEGGENNVHAHMDHAHAFVVLDGQATFHDKDGNATVLNKYEGILLPIGTAYRFYNSGDEPLVLLRTAGGKTGAERTRATGKTGPAAPPLTLDQPTRSGGVPIPGKFFGA
jgi:mannose-6-phosphate isomerase-like protein (cupin superfamily)